jgi:3-oxoacyl-[acyl-carrier protein] reductase
VGKIIKISSVSSIKGMPGQSVYSATKGAIDSMTRVLAKGCLYMEFK